MMRSTKEKEKTFLAINKIMKWEREGKGGSTVT
jgi:hypothetical protein